jgi:hypothetical protein
MENEILQRCRVRTTAELEGALKEVEWLDDQVARGLMEAENGYLRMQYAIIETKRAVLGLS